MVLTIASFAPPSLNSKVMIDEERRKGREEDEEKRKEGRGERGGGRG